MQRRDFIRISAGVAMASPFISKSAISQDSGDLVYCGAGGAVREAGYNSIRAPFGLKYGIKVVDAYPYDTGKLATMVKTKTVAWDVTDIPGAQVGLAIKQGLVEPIDYSIVSKNGMPSDMFGEHYIRYGYVSSNIAYNSSVYKNKAPSRGWLDFWDQAKFPGPRTLRKTPAVTLESALLADGVDPARLYPLDLDRAFRKLDEIKRHIRWWDSGGAAIDLLVKGETDIGTTFSNRVFVARKDGAPIDVVWNGGALAGLYFVVPKGAKNRVNAMKFLNHMLQADTQATLAKVTRYSPINADAFQYVDDELKAELATSPSHVDQLYRVDEVGYWAENFDSVSKRFDSWLIGR